MVMMQKNCHKCGAVVMSEARFCPHCGQTLMRGKHKQHRILVTTVILTLAFVLITGGIFTVSRLSQSQQQEKIEAAIQAADEDELEDLLVDENKLAMPEDNVEALVHLLRADTEAKRALIEQLRGDSSMATLVRAGHYAGILPAYKLQLKPKTVHVQAVDKETQYYLDDTLIGRGTAFKLTAGQYTVNVVRRLAGRTDSAKQQVIIPIKGAVNLSVTRNAIATSAVAVANQSEAALAHAIIAKFKPNIDARNNRGDASALIGDWETGESEFELKADGQYKLEREDHPDEKGTYTVIYHDAERYNLSFVREDGQQAVHAFVLYDGKLVNATTKELWQRN